jgi:hypothetical protein
VQAATVRIAPISDTCTDNIVGEKRVLQGAKTEGGQCVPNRDLGSPYSQHGTLWQARGGPQCLETIRAGDNRAIVLCRPR